MQLRLSSALAWFNAITGSAEVSDDADRVRNVAIIGAGAAGSSAAYHLQQYASASSLPINITIFEKTDRIGGRTQTVDVYDSPLEPVEVGASIFVELNHILFNATSRFNLPTGGMSDSEPGDLTAIWDGETIVFQSSEGASWWWDAAKMFWRYGTSPYYAVRLVKETVGKFLRMYEEPLFPFRSLTGVAGEVGLQDVTVMTGEQLLEAKKINPDFSRHIIQAATRVNYASNLKHIHGLEAMVSFATDGAMAVTGGNWQIFDNMVRHSEAAVHLNTTVTSIFFASKKKSTKTKPRYAVSTAIPETAADDVAATTAAVNEKVPVVFDEVIIASPWQFSDIKTDDGVLTETIDEIPYMKLHVTLFTSPFKLHAEYFGLDPGSKAPSNVYTTLKEDEEAKQGPDGVGNTGFYSISTLRTVENPQTQRKEYLYKIFSAEAVTPHFLSDILGAAVPDTFTGVVPSSGLKEEDQTEGVETISWYYPTWFHSYPVELPRVTFQEAGVGDGVWYTSGMESFISTMETSALMGMNVARLIADEMVSARKLKAEEAQEVGGADREEL